jgi:hypothetical protein
VKNRLRRRSVLLFALAVCLLTPALLPAAQPPPQKGNRFLFILNTSTAMRRQTNGVLQAVRGLLQSGMNGEMRDGDTFGLWTYDEQLHTDFPMQVWSKRNQDETVAGMTAYLAGLRYQNRAHLEKVLPAMSQMIASSRVITLIFIYDGTETMQGSGFDKDINDLQRQFGRQMRDQNLPFVTLLAAWNGKTIDYSVNPPGKISVPQTADLIQPPVTNAPPAVVAAVPAPPPVVVPKPPEPRHREIIFSNPPPPNPPAPAVAESAQNVPTNAVSVPQSVAAQTPGATAPLVAPQPPASPPASGAAIRTDPTERTDLLSAAAPPVTAGTVVPASSAVPERGGALASAALSAATVAPPGPTTPVQATPAPAATPPPVQPARAPAQVVPQTAVVMPAPGDHIALLVIAFSLLTIAVVLVLLLSRRSRGTPSLITQSLDHRR